MNFFLFNLTFDINVSEVKSATNNNSKSTPQEEQRETKYGCTCKCYKQNNLPRYKCVIFIKKNYDFTNEYVNTKLLMRYRERNNKEFICKKCHDNLKYGQRNQSNELQKNMTTMCICCDNIIILQHNTLEFDQLKYKLKGKFLEILENRQTDMAMKKYMCNSCDILLRNGCSQQIFYKTV